MTCGLSSDMSFGVGVDMLVDFGAMKAMVVLVVTVGAMRVTDSGS